MPQMETESTDSNRSESSRSDGQPASDGQSASFSSTLSTYVTLLGYTIGASDIWRLPYLVYKNGGGAFFIPFILTIILCGIPLFFLEYTLSNFSGKGPYLIWDICPLFRGVGITLAAAYILFMAGSSIFRGWLSVFLIHSFKDPLPWTTCDNDWNTPGCRPNHFIADTTVSTASSVTFDDATHNVNDVNVMLNQTKRLLHLNGSEGKFMTAAEEFWQFESLNLSDGLTDLGEMQWRIVLFVAILRVIVFCCASKSIASIEKVMYLLLFAPILFILAVFIQSLTLPGAAAGLYKFFYPDFSKLANARVNIAPFVQEGIVSFFGFCMVLSYEIWIEAFLMVFYTMAFGWGAIITLGSHANFRDNCIRTSIWIPILDATVGILNGAVCFSVLGNMAYSHGVEVDQVLSTGFSAGIVSYVTSLSSLPVPHFWNVAFFVTAIMAGLDSQIVPVEMCVQIIGESFPGLYPRYRLHVLGGLSVLLFVLALPTCTRAGGYMFLWCDWFVGVWSGPICALVEVITVAWIYGMDRFSEDVYLMIGRRLPVYFRVTMAFVAPILLVIIFLTSCVEYVPPKYGDYLYPWWARGLGWTIVAVILSPILIKAVMQVLRQKGPIVQRIRHCMKEKSTWGPKEVAVKEEYLLKKATRSKRTFKSLLRFLVFGASYRTSDKVNQSELVLLNKA